MISAAGTQQGTRPTPGAVPDGGMSVGVCRICGNDVGNRPLRLREMMFGSHEEFDYFQCGRCDAIQIRDIPGDLARFYPTTYYAFAGNAGRTPKRVHGFIEDVKFRGVVQPSFRAKGRWHDFLDRWEALSPGIDAIGRARIDFQSSVLEVGCGGGKNLDAMYRLGFRKLTGIDPYLPEDVHRNGISLLKREIFDLDPSARFDFILLYHSLEHVTSPLAELRSVREHLTAEGTVLVAMPMVGEAFRIYRENWFQLDPPRHLHIFSPSSWDIALSATGLGLRDSYYNSTAAQFRVSERYARNVPMTSVQVPLVRPLAYALSEGTLRSRARAVNRARCGDQAVFYLHRIAEVSG